jgi:hypothetical protein
LTVVVAACPFPVLHGTYLSTKDFQFTSNLGSHLLVPRDHNYDLDDNNDVQTTPTAYSYPPLQLLRRRTTTARVYGRSNHSSSVALIWREFILVTYAHHCRYCLSQLDCRFAAALRPRSPSLRSDSQLTRHSLLLPLDPHLLTLRTQHIDQHFSQ